MHCVPFNWLCLQFANPAHFPYNYPMEKDIKFSIILPTYGVANYIAEALGCLMTQTYDNFEAIVVDDCSPDRSGEIARGFAEKDDRFFYVKHEQNMGVSAARNTGISKATGDYILFLDPDDTYESHLLAVLASTLNRNPVDLLIYSFTEEYKNPDTGKTEYSKAITLADLDFDDDVFTTNDATTIHKLAIQMEKITMLGYPWNKAFKASVIKDNGLQYQKIKHVEDILFNCDVLDHIRSLTIVHDILYHYRNQGQSRLTGGTIDNYFELQKTRVKRIYEQQQEWKTCDFEALSIIASVYFRSFQSNMVRMLESGATDEAILTWCNTEATDELYKELKGYLPDEGKTIKFLYKPLADGLFGSALRRAKLIGFTRAHFPGIFNRAKQIR